MQKQIQTVKSERIADTSRFIKRIGSVTYEINVFFNQDAKETMDVKIKRLIRNEGNGGEYSGSGLGKVVGL